MEKLLKQRVEILAQEIDKMKSGGAGEGYTKSEADAKFLSKDDASTALAEKQDSLDQTQLEAVNSGIDSTKAAQIETNKTNISYALDKTGKNFLDCSLDRLKAVNNEGTWNGNVYTVASVGTVTINSDNTLTVVKTGTSARLLFYLSSNQEAAAISGDKFAGYILSGCPSGGSSTTYRLTGEEISSPWSTVVNDYGSGDTIQSSTLQVGFYISIHADYTTTGSGLTFKPMICTEADWNISKNYAPFALPNSDLTQLEQQDRSALAEVVDSGAKNRIKLTQPSGNGITLNPSLSVTVNEKTGVVTVSGTTVASDFIYLTDVYSNLDGYVLSGKPEITEEYLLRAYSVVGDVSMADDAGDGNGGVISGNQECRVSLYVYANKSYNFTFKPMICTIADWNVSKAYQPYRPSYQELYEMVLALQTTRTATTRKTTKTKTNEE